MKNFDLKKVIFSLLGLIIGGLVMIYITSTEGYQHFAHFATVGSRQTNTGWILLVAASLGWFFYVIPTIIDKLGHLVALAMFGIILTAWVELVYGEWSVITVVFMTIVTVFAFFLTMLYKNR